MRYLFGTFIFCLSVFLNRIELSSSANFMVPFIPSNEPEIPFYANREGVLIPLIAGNIPDLETTPTYLLGLRLNGQLLPLFDRHRRWVFMLLQNFQVVIVSPQLYHAYGHRYPASIISQLENRNNVEFVMPIRHRNASPNSPTNRRREYN